MITPGAVTSSNVTELMGNLTLEKHSLNYDSPCSPKRPRKSFGFTDFNGPLSEKVQVVIPVYPHSIEEQELFIDITEAATSDDPSERLRGIGILTHDATLQPLLFRLVYFIYDSVRVNIIQEFPFLLRSLMGMVDAMLQNDNLNIEPGLFKLLPAVISVLVAKPMKRHFRQKQDCALLLTRIVKSEPGLKQRICDVLLTGLYRCDCSIYATFGVICAFHCLGDDVLENYLFPNLNQVKINLMKSNSEEKDDAWFVLTAVRHVIRSYVQKHDNITVQKFKKMFEIFVFID